MHPQQLERLSFEDAERVLQFQKQHGMGFGEAAQHLGLVGETATTGAGPQQAQRQQAPDDYPSLRKGQGNYPPELVAAYKPFIEEVKILRAVHAELMLRWFSRGRRALVIAGVDPDDATSFVAANLAVVFSQSGSNTLLIDANLRHPRQHRIFNVDSALGLSAVLGGYAGVDAITRIDDFRDLSVMPAGPLSHEKHTLVNSATFGAVREKCAARFGVALIDAPPFSEGNEAMTLAACAGGVLLVARKHKTRLAEINALSAQFAQVNAEVVGSILLEF